MAGAIAYKGKIYFEGGGLSPESLASYEATSTASKAYAIGDLIVLGDLLYEVTAPIASGDTIVVEGASANVVQTSVEEQLDNIEPDVSGKADKVASATNGNLAKLDSNGNLADSGVASADVVTTSSTAGLIKNDGSIDTTDYASAISGKADSSAIDSWSSSATVDSNNQVTFTGLNDTYGYSLYCNNGNLVGIEGVEKTGSGAAVQLVFTLSNVSQGDTCKLRIMKG